MRAYSAEYMGIFPYNVGRHYRFRSWHIYLPL